MRPLSWHPSAEPSFLEQTIITRIKRAKLFDDAFQEELVTLYAPSLRGHPLPLKLFGIPERFATWLGLSAQ